jgi:hypothetical protein
MTQVATNDTLASLSKRDQWKATTLVRLNVTKNPKKKPSMSYDRFKGYFAIDWTIEGGVSVQDCLDEGLRMDDIRHDSGHGYISLAENGAEFAPVAEDADED